MRILLLGDFSGRANRSVVETGPALAKRPIRRVDVDNFEQLLADYQPRLSLPLQGHQLELAFSGLDDFHPDSLYQRLDLFQALRRLRGRLANPDTFPQAAAELRHEATPTPAAGSDSSAAEEREGESDMFQRLLGKVPVATDSIKAARTTGIDDFIRGIVAPHIVPEVDLAQPTYIASVDNIISSQMRQLLHEPAFQALESIWWSAHRLVTSLETGEELKLYLLDLTKQELMADISAAGADLQNSAIHKLLVEQSVETLGGEAWSLLAGDYSFGTSADETALLAALGALASRAGGPFLATATAELLGCQSLARTPAPEQWQTLEWEEEQRWQALRSSPMACWIGLVLPRVLQRLPYGGQAEAIETFEFEEIPCPPGDHEAYLWGSAGFACAMLLGEAFLDQGWSMQPGDRLDIEDLPAYSYLDGEEQRLLPCAETLLSERTGETILKRGLMPLLSYRNRNTVRVLRFQSIADPLTALAGSWG